MIPVVLFVLVLLAVIGLALLSLRIERRRTEAMTFACGAMGFTFTEKATPDATEGTGGLSLFRRGHSRRARNLMLGGTSDGLEVKLFDYRYTVGSGKNAHTTVQTVVLYSGVDLALPEFVLAPENVFHRIGQAFGYQDIDFESSPEFSSSYLLRGPDEMAIRSALDHAVPFFASEQGWTVEGKGEAVVIYRANDRCKPENVQTFLAETERVLRALV